MECKLRFLSQIRRFQLNFTHFHRRSVFLGQISIENGPHPAVFHRFLADRHFWGKKAKFH